ncbi:MAG: hypothetical protein RLZZ623_2262 [Actinomycetota bacterium]|jgi:hypothetical protein
MNTVLSVAVLGFMAVRLATGLRVSRTGSGRLLVDTVRRRIGWRHLWPIPFVLAVVVAAASALMSVPGLSWGWWSSIGGEGNPVFGSSDATSGSFLEWLIPLVFMAMLLPALPLFANAEERIFRAGAEHWSPVKRVSKTLQFGLVHAIIGIPIGAALALSIGGAYFMRVYLRRYRATSSREEATMESTTAHTAYNGVIIMIVVLAIILTAAGV